MTNEITTSKAEFALVLQEAGLDVYPYVPNRITPPVIVMRSGGPYLTPSTLGNDYYLGLELILLATTAVNEVATEALDELIQATLNAMPNYALVTDVAQPSIFNENGADYYGCVISLTLEITL
jgi:hypothetical protein